MVLDEAWQLTPMPRDDSPSSKCSLNASRNFRMDSLSAAITTSELGAALVGELSSVVNAQARSGDLIPSGRSGDRLGSESVIGMVRNG